MMGLLVACEGRPTGMTLGLLPTSLTVIFRYVLPIGKAHPLILLLHLDRSPVRIGIRGGIVAIEHARARKVAIVSIAQTDRAANGVSEGSTCSFKRAVQSYYIFMVSASQRANLTIYIFGEGLARRRGDRLSAVVFSVLYEHHFTQKALSAPCRMVP